MSKNESIVKVVEGNIIYWYSKTVYDKLQDPDSPFRKLRAGSVTRAKIEYAEVVLDIETNKLIKCKGSIEDLIDTVFGLKENYILPADHFMNEQP